MATEVNLETTANFGVSDAVRLLYRALDVRIGESDPAPWLHIDGDQLAALHPTEPHIFARDRKVQDRAALVLTRALMAGELVAQVRDVDNDSVRAVPAWMWENMKRPSSWFGALPMPVVLPGDWQRFEIQNAFLSESDFAKWLESEAPYAPGYLPEIPPPWDIADKPSEAPTRQPPHEAAVTLSEALSWMAFSYSVDNQSLDRAHDEGSFGEPIVFVLMLNAAVERLVSVAKAGKLRLLGRLTYDGDTGEPLTEKIEPIRLNDFGQFDILRDGLRRGKGLTWSDPQSGYSATFSHGLTQHYRDVKVDRNDLMSHFPQLPSGSTAIESQCKRTLVVQTKSRCDWHIADAIVWHFDRHEGRVNDQAFCVPHLTGAMFYPNIGYGQRWIDSARAVIATMKAGEIAAGRLNADGVVTPIAAGFWNQVKATDLDKEQYANVVVPAASVRSVFPAPETSAGDTIVQLFRLWSDEVKRNYHAERDRICDEFILAGRSQSANHIRCLSEAADRCVTEMLTKARALPMLAENYDVALVRALALFDELADDVRDVAIGASGRNPTPANRGVADRFANEARTRHAAKVDEWRLEDKLRFSAALGNADAKQNTSRRAPAVKAGYPPNDWVILAKADEMKARGMNGRDIAKEMRHEEGFANISVVSVRALLKGRWTGGRPSAKPA